MTPVRTPTILAATALLALAAGCGSDEPSEPAAATTAPTSAVDTSRAVCHQVSTTEAQGVTAHLEPGVAVTVARQAQLSPDFEIAAAGLGLLDAGEAAAAVADPRGDLNLDVAQAWLDLAKACGDLYGDGPW